MIPFRKRAFTLVEVMMVVAIISLTLAGAYMAWNEGTVRQKSTSEKLLILADMRQIGQEMMREARNSNRFYIFKDYPADVDVAGEVTSGEKIMSGASGNYLVLESLNAEGTMIERVGYYIDSSTKALIKYRQLYDGSGVPAMPQGNPPSGSQLTQKTILKEVMGDHADGGLFYNYGSRVILVQGRFSENLKTLAAGAMQELKRAFTYQLEPLFLQ